MKKLLVLFSWLILVPTVASSQVKTVRGTVVDNEGMPLVGVVVSVGGAQTATVTDAEGAYTINASPDAILYFSMLGFKEVKETLNGRDKVDVILSLDQVTLDDAVVIGYGTQKKSDLTGAVSVVSADDINSAALASVDQALQGRIAGVDIVSSGEPGTDASIRIRGTRSITASNNPLIVVDGIVGAVENFNDINPDDIKNITILKDVSSTAIYGARGANGVILITTNGGSKGDTNLKIDFLASVGMSELPKKLDVMNAAEFARWRNDYYYPDEVFADPESYGKGTDWQDELTRKAVSQSYSLRVSDGNSKSHLYASVSYDNRPGIVVETGMRRLSALLKADRKFFDWLKAGVRVNYIWRHNDVNKIAINGISSTSAVSLSPLVGVRDVWNRYSDQSDASSSVFNSPLSVAEQETNYRRNSYLNLAPWVEIIPFKGAVLRSTYSFAFNNKSSWYYSPSTLPLAVARKTGGTATWWNTERSIHLSETTLNWKKELSRRQFIDLTAGFTAEAIRDDYHYTKGVGYVDDNVGPNSLGSLVDKRNLTSDSSITDITRLSVIARANYSYHSRYHATLTARYDGSSNFSAGNKWAFFPAAAFKWTISNETWMGKAKHSGLSNLAVRLSAGLNGNDAVPSYVSQAAMASGSGTWLFGTNPELIAYPSRLGDSTLTWEKTLAANLGVDVSLFKDRISMTMDSYMSFTNDLLLQVQNAKHTGYATRYANVGSTKGWGVEFTLDSRNIVRPRFSWRTTFTISHATSVVTDIGADYEYIPTYSRGTQMLFGYKKGYPVNAMWGYQFCGVWQNDQQREDNAVTHAYVSYANTNGYSKYADINHDGILNKDDLVYLGSSDPVVHGSLSNVFHFYNWEINAYFTYSIGGKIYNLSEILLGTADTSSNKYTYMIKDAWHEERNPNGTLPGSKTRAEGGFGNSRFVHDSSFLRLKNLSVTYRINMSKKVKWLRGISLSLMVDNLFLLTGYNGFDPDVSSSSAVARLDNASYPNPRTYMFGVKIKY